jgi:dihydrofolate synthase/folylpolyglutamate synthase
MNYQEVIEYMYGMLPMYQRIGSDAFKKDLTNTIALCEALENPQDSFRCIHIAGTNGKGSTSHMLAAIFQESGYKTGLYTSPHLKDFNERIKINGIPIDRQAIVDFILANKAVIEDIRPSFFELTVAMAFYYFAVNQVDIAIIEVGLGGRLDSTNVLTPLLSVITNISLDHQDMLGNTLKEIAFEKAGIIKDSVPVIIGESDPETEPVFLSKASEMKAPIFFADKEISVFENSRKNHQVNLVISGSKLIEEIQVRNPAAYQQRNIPAVIRSIEIINQTGLYTVSAEAVFKGIALFETTTGFKGRWQILSEKPMIIADIGHNQAGLQANMEQLLQLKWRNLIIVMGLVKEKQLDKIIPLLPSDAYYFVCQPNVPRGLNAEILHAAMTLAGLNGEVVPDVNKAYHAALQMASQDDVIFVGGSTFVVSELKNI